MITKYNLYKESLLNKLQGPDEAKILKDILSKYMNRMLLECCRKGILSGVKYAVENGANVNIIDNSNGFDKHSLYLACNEGNYEIVKYLMENGADININTSSDTLPLKIAAHRGYEDIVELLLNYKPSNEQLCKALNYACYAQELEIIKMLLEYGVKSDDCVKLETPMEISINRNNYEITKLLLDYGASITSYIKSIVKNSNGNIKKLINEYDNKI